jgi:hypothetical protein
LKKKRESCDGRDCGRKERSYDGVRESLERVLAFFQ